jgi:hypothetical protein
MKQAQKLKGITILSRLDNKIRELIHKFEKILDENLKIELFIQFEEAISSNCCGFSFKFVQISGFVMEYLHEMNIIRGET